MERVAGCFGGFLSYYEMPVEMLDNLTAGFEFLGMNFARYLTNFNQTNLCIVLLPITSFLLTEVLVICNAVMTAPISPNVRHGLFF